MVIFNIIYPSKYLSNDSSISKVENPIESNGTATEMI
jgi:hypothetical protein